VTKEDVFTDLLQQGRVRVHLDARRPGVVLPPSRLTEKHLALDYGRNLSIPTTDVEVDGYGVKATLSFDRQQSVAFVPWSAIWAITDASGIGRIYPEDMPDGIEFPRSSVQVPGHQGWVH
jgi:stringent starvation protein B